MIIAGCGFKPRRAKQESRPCLGFARVTRGSAAKAVVFSHLPCNLNLFLENGTIAFLAWVAPLHYYACGFGPALVAGRTGGTASRIGALREPPRGSSLTKR